MSYRHAAVWLDSKEAHVFRLDAGAFVESLVSAPETPANADTRVGELLFFDEIAKLLKETEGIFLAGPAEETDHFRSYAIGRGAALPLSIERVELVSTSTNHEFKRRARNYLTTECQGVAIDSAVTF